MDTTTRLSTRSTIPLISNTNVYVLYSLRSPLLVSLFTPTLFSPAGCSRDHSHTANTQLLRSHGLETTSCQLYPRPTPLSTDLHGWLTMFIRNTAFSTFSDDVAEQYMREIVEMAKIDTYWSDNEVGYGLENGNAHADVAGDAKDKGKAQEGWNLMYVRLRGLAVKPPSRQSE